MLRRHQKLCLGILIVGIGLGSMGESLVAQTIAWPQFRGPSANSLTDSKDAPTVWGESQNVAWQIDVAGNGWSAPIVVGNSVFLTTAVEKGADESGLHSYELHCYDVREGTTKWKKVLLETNPSQGTHRDNTYASETPVTDGEFIYAYFGMTGLFCVDLQGEVVWQKQLGSYPMANDWGTSSSPVLHEGMIYVQLDNEEESHLLALDTKNGTEKWRVARSEEVSTWSTPIIWKNSKRAEIVLGGKTIRSYDPSTGAENWNMHIGGRSSASPSAVGDVLYIGSENRSRRGGTPGGLFAVTSEADGEIDVTAPADTQNGLLWADLRGAIGMASPLVYQGNIYVPERRGGMLRVVDAETGEEQYRKRLPNGANFWSSPWAYQDRVFCLDEKGKTFILSPGSDYDVLGENKLTGRFWSTPAIAGDSLVLRSETSLICVR